MNQGWIKIHRQVQHTSLWLREPFTRGQAWIDLLMLANHEDGWILVRGIRVVVKRGQVGWAEVSLAKRWQWSRSKAKAYLSLLETEQQIVQHRNNTSLLITIRNYDLYQTREQQNEQQKSSRKTAKEQQKDTNKNDKNDKKGKKDCGETPPRLLQHNLIPLALFALAKGITFDNSDQLRAFLRRFLTASSNLQGYAPEKILRTFFFCVDDAKGKYDVTLETIGKKIDMHHDHKLTSPQQREFGDILAEYEKLKDVLFTKTSPLIHPPK